MTTLAIHELESRQPVDAEAVDSFLAEHGFPLLEGSTTTFVWRGEADEVVLQHWIYGLKSALPFKRLEGSNLWWLTMDLPARSRVEYKIGVARGSHRRLVRDPLNHRAARDPFGANSVVPGPGYERPEWTLPDADARPGDIEELVVPSEVFGGERTHYVYLPPRFRRSRRYPLLVAHDGLDYMRFAGLKTVLDNLVSRQEVAPLVVVLTESPYRLEEYNGDPRHGRFLVEELVPAVERAYPVLAAPRARGLMGASFGAVASLGTAWRHQGSFGRLLLQSGSFAFTDVGDQHGRGPAFDPVVRFMNEFRAHPGRPSEKVFLSCGTHESLIYENRSILPLLQATGMKVKYAEAPDGHNWENWRDRLRPALAWLFPGPLWMVYE